MVDQLYFTINCTVIENVFLLFKYSATTDDKKNSYDRAYHFETETKWTPNDIFKHSFLNENV